MDETIWQGSSWIWLAEGTVNQYVTFRQKFQLARIPEASTLYLSVDTEYVAFLNGRLIGMNQYDDYPDDKSYDTLEIAAALQMGENELRIEAYYQGENSFQYITGPAGLRFALQAGALRIGSGTETDCCLSPHYRSGPIENISNQLRFTFHYDARGDEADWQKACVVWERSDTALYPRPLPKLVLDAPVPGRLCTQGIFRWRDGDTVAQRMQHAWLSTCPRTEVWRDGVISPTPKDADGCYFLFDLGREEAGIFTLEVEGEAGAKLFVAYGEHLEDLRVRAFVGNRNFAFSYVLKMGVNRFTHPFKRIAGRYIQVFVSHPATSLVLRSVGIIPVRYPLTRRGAFSCTDTGMNAIYETAVRTLTLCMHEHYEDTPWREQALYAMDSRNQALCGYCCFGEADFAIASFQLIAQSLRSDGLFEICAPARDHLTIPCFSMSWILAVRDLVLYTGRMDAAHVFFPTVRTLLQGFMDRCRDGLMETPRGKPYWNFYEWVDGLDGGSYLQDWEDGTEPRVDAPLNLFFSLALDAAETLADWLGETEAQTMWRQTNARLRQAIHRAFFDPVQRAYRTYRGALAHFATLTQALALCAQVVPQAEAEQLRARLASGEEGWAPTTLSYTIYSYQALLQEEKYRRTVLRDIRTQWGRMLAQGATSFWETQEGASAFEDAGSLCHGWSAVPVYLYTIIVLGVTPLSPGFQRFTFMPEEGLHPQGVVPTPYGEIVVDGATVQYPQGIEWIK